MKIYKSIFISLLLLFFLSEKLHSQTNALTAVDIKHKEVFSTLNLQNIPTGILYQLVPEYVELPKFDGTLLEDSSLIVLPLFKMAYGMMSSAHIVQSDLISLEAFNTISKQHEAITEIHISLMHFNYNRLKKNAILIRNLLAIYLKICLKVCLQFT